MNTKNKEEIRNELIRESKENHKKFEEAMREINDELSKLCDVRKENKLNILK